MNIHACPDPLLSAALDYGQRGWHVFPLRNGTKGSDASGRSTHLLPDGHKGATDDPEKIREWWTRWPDANIGLNLAASGLVALDPDLYKTDCEWAAFIRGRDLPRTLVQSSARGGKHYIFTTEPDIRYAGTLCAGVEIKHQGYILLEPSVFEGSVYRFETDDDPVPTPDWIPRRDGPDRGSRTSVDRSPSQGIGPPPPAVDFGFASSSAATTGEVEELLTWLDPDAGGYEAWIKVLQALHDHYGGGSDGLHLADTWSRRGAKYVPGEVEAKWRGFRAGGGVTIKTVAAFARSKGADLSDISRRGRSAGGQIGSRAGPSEEVADLSHDNLALDLGVRSWDANARHVALWGKWLFWNGSCWKRDETLYHLSATRAYLRTRAEELLRSAESQTQQHMSQEESGKARKIEGKAREQARVLRSSATVIAVSNLARANPTTAVTHEAFDLDKFLIGTPAGTVDLRSGMLRASRREDMISRLTTCAPAASGIQPERWLRFLEEIMDGDAETIAFLQRAAGYALTGSTDEHKLLFLHGSGRNGKSVFLGTLLDIWGDYGRRVTATTFLNSQTERHPTDIAGLHGARLAVASELPRGKTWDEATIKDLTGGDRLTARFMRQDFFDFTPQLTLMIAGNTQPSFRGVDEAIRSRVVLVPFQVTIPEAQRDRTLPDRLRDEASAILRWCVDGAVAWRERGLDVPSSIMAASAAYFDEEDTLGQFLGDEIAIDPQAFVPSDDLILRFNFWSERQGLGGWTKRTLVKELKQRGFTDTKSNGRRGLRGLRLR